MSSETSARPKLVTVPAVKATRIRSHIVRRVADGKVFLACGQWVWAGVALDSTVHSAALCPACKANS